MCVPFFSLGWLAGSLNMPHPFLPYLFFRGKGKWWFEAAWRNPPFVVLLRPTDPAADGGVLAGRLLRLLLHRKLWDARERNSRASGARRKGGRRKLFPHFLPSTRRGGERKSPRATAGLKWPKVQIYGPPTG